jgi:mannose-6-phosphate isomerase-like protein (cupin superfamily)
MNVRPAMVAMPQMAAPTDQRLARWHDAHMHPCGTGDDARSDRDAIHAFVASCANRLSALADRPPAATGAAAFARTVAHSTPLSFAAGWLPALDTATAVDPTPLGRQFVELAPLLPWEPTFRTDDRGAHIALAPLNRVFDFGELTVGLMYVAPGHVYPLHAHPPNELYLTIAGRGEWRFGGHDEFRSIEADTALYNRPGDPHSARAGDTPLVALYVLWG